MSRWLSMVGLAVVLAAAAVLSFAALRDLAIAVRINAQLAFLLPVAVDAGAAVSCAVWLSPTGRRDARRFACWLTWALLTLTVAANAAATGWHALEVTPPWWAAVIVGAIPPAVVGGVVHLLVLVGRADVPAHTEPVVEDKPTEELPPLEDNGLSLWWRDAPKATPLPAPEPVRKPSRPAAPPPDVDLDRARELVADGAGRVRLQNELGLSEYQARELKRTLSTNGHAS